MTHIRSSFLGLLLVTIFSSNVVAAPANPLHVSMIWLLVNPKAYASKEIVVQGYLSLQKEDSRLYFDCSSYMYFEQVNSIAIHLDAQNFSRFQKLQGRYVQVIGVFAPEDDYKHHIMQGRPAGVIRVDTYKSVAAIQPILSRGGKSALGLCANSEYNE